MISDLGYLPVTPVIVNKKKPAQKKQFFLFFTMIPTSDILLIRGIHCTLLEHCADWVKRIMSNNFVGFADIESLNISILLEKNVTNKTR